MIAAIYAHKSSNVAAEWITVEVPGLRMTRSSQGNPGAVHQAATALVTLHLRKRQRGQLPPLRRNTYTVNCGLFLPAPAQKADSDHPQSEKTQRSGFGNGFESRQTNRVTAGKADDVAATIPR